MLDIFKRFFLYSLILISMIGLAYSFYYYRTYPYFDTDRYGKYNEDCIISIENKYCDYANQPYSNLTPVIIYNKDKIDQNKILDPEIAKSIIEEKSFLILNYIKDNDIASLTKFIHPKYGIRFIPLGYPLSDDKVFSAKNFAKIQKEDDKIFSWGIDMSGNKIEMTFAQYRKIFLYNEDFLESKQIFFNRHKSGSFIANKENKFLDNLILFYPYSIQVEYKKNLSSLTLIFEQYDKDWYLVAIVANRR